MRNRRGTWEKPCSCPYLECDELRANDEHGEFVIEMSTTKCIAEAELKRAGFNLVGRSRGRAKCSIKDQCIAFIFNSRNTRSAAAGPAFALGHYHSADVVWESGVPRATQSSLRAEVEWRRTHHRKEVMVICAPGRPLSTLVGGESWTESATQRGSTAHLQAAAATARSEAAAAATAAAAVRPVKKQKTAIPNGKKKKNKKNKKKKRRKCPLVSPEGLAEVLRECVSDDPFSDSEEPEVPEPEVPEPEKQACDPLPRPCIVITLNS
jgi:hypothetical protein